MLRRQDLTARRGIEGCMKPTEHLKFSRHVAQLSYMTWQTFGNHDYKDNRVSVY